MVLKANNLSNVMSPLSDYSTGEHFTFGSNDSMELSSSYSTGDRPGGKVSISSG